MYSLETTLRCDVQDQHAIRVRVGVAINIDMWRGRIGTKRRRPSLLRALFECVLKHLNYTQNQYTLSIFLHASQPTTPHQPATTTESPVSDVARRDHANLARGAIGSHLRTACEPKHIRG